MKKNIKTADSYILYSETNYSEISAFRKISNNLSEWHLLILLRKGGIVRMFYDDTEVPIFEGFMKPDTIDMRHPWYIGTFSGNNPNYLVGGKQFNYSFKGFIDDVRIYNRTITDKEIKLLYNQKGQ